MDVASGVYSEFGPQWRIIYLAPDKFASFIYLRHGIKVKQPDLYAGRVRLAHLPDNSQ